MSLGLRSEQIQLTSSRSEPELRSSPQASRSPGRRASENAPMFRRLGTAGLCRASRGQSADPLGHAPDVRRLSQNDLSLRVRNDDLGSASCHRTIGSPGWWPLTPINRCGAWSRPTAGHRFGATRRACPNRLALVSFSGPAGRALRRQTLRRSSAIAVPAARQQSRSRRSSAPGSSVSGRGQRDLCIRRKYPVDDSFTLSYGA